MHLEEGVHVADDGFARLPGPNPAAMALKQELSEIILWNEQNSPRSKQVAIGPSELGDACDRRLAYRIAGVPAVNIWADPWPAIVGTSIHAWLEKAINQYQERNGDRGWLTELRVRPDEMVQGSSDVFNARTGTVVDWKAQPVDERVLTPDGWRTMGDLKVGDQVIGRDGRAVKVEGVYPLGRRQVYKVWTSDHEYTEACAEHLWEVRCRDANRRRKIMTTADLIAELAKSRPQYQILPDLEPVHFGPGPELPLDPYALGLLLGDGGLRGQMVKFTNADGLEKFLPFKTNLNHSAERCPTFGVIGAVPVMRELGLLDHLSVDKFIPEIYLRASVDDRLALLQGLMDTDGCLQKGHPAFTTSSDRLATDFTELVQSLGGKVFTHKDRRLRKGATRLAYLIRLKLPPTLCPFRADIARKKLSLRPHVETHERFIKSIEPSRVTEVQCIKVGSDDGLYVTRGYIVTHNTAGLDIMRKLHKGQPPKPGYVTQIQLYGLGHTRAGRKVNNVCLVYLPRSGWLDDAYVWVAPYDESVAVAALDRMYRVGGQCIELDVEANPHRFEQVEATPGDSCVWCPFFNKELHIEIAASDKGCPGR
jgi:hypothetical protein